jgi:signal transduction histidine kinase
VHGKQFLRVYVSPISHENTSIGCAILIEDVTEARILARSKDEFFTIASHELRTPLIAIRGYASMIKEFFPDKLPDADLIRMVDRIDTSGQRLISIVNSFLDVSRLEQGKMDFKIEQFDLNEVIKACVEELQTVAAEKHLGFAFEPNPALPQLNTDKNLTKQVLYNLIGNAIKFTEHGGVSVEARREDDHATVLVHDTGGGVPPEAQALLFRKFQQTGDSLFTRDNSQGTGLGLYISKLIIEGLGGSIGLRESSEKGSTFYFTLPIGSES